MDEQEFVFGCGFTDASGQHAGGGIVAQEDVQFVILLCTAPLTQAEPDGIFEPTGHDEKDQRNGEKDGQDKDGEIRQKQERFPEDDGGDDIVEHYGVADEHLQRGQGGYQEQLDPVAVRDRMGGAGQQHHVHNGTCDKQECKNSQDSPPLTPAEQTPHYGNKKRAENQ